MQKMRSMCHRAERTERKVNNTHETEQWEGMGGGVRQQSLLPDSSAI